MIKAIQLRSGVGVGLILVAAALSGCNDLPKRDPNFAATLPALPPAPVQQSTGAIYQAGSTMPLFEDVRAHRVGDMLTVVLTESTDASKSTSSDVSKSDATTVANPTIFGASPQFALPGALPLTPLTKNSLDTNLSSSGSFSGKGDSSQKNSLTGDITVTVADVLPNGNLFVRGEKRMKLNDGNEYIKVSGYVRPIDIASNNSVASTQLADATIVYNGDGQAADSGRMGWLARFFNSPIFPF